MRKLLRVYHWLNRPLRLQYVVADLGVAIPRVIGGYLLAVDFGASKFGMPWTPDDRKISFEEKDFTCVTLKFNQP